SIADAGRDLVRRRDPDRTPSDQVRANCELLLSNRGEASGVALAREVVQAYDRMDAAARRGFFGMLARDFGVDPQAVVDTAETYASRRDLDSFLALSAAAEPPRQELIRRLNMAPGGTPAIVAMRRDLLALLPEHPELAAVDADLRHLLGSWFNRGFLVLERIDWRSPAAVLEKLMRYEAVHRMDGWDDLRRRLADDRRCFAFFHPALPEEPLIFVQVALVDHMAGAISPLLDRTAAPADPTQANTAIFYSISNCQAGLKGISFGNFLLKQVVVELQRELPNLQTFATLSPIPGFCRWLDAQIDAEDGTIDASDRRILTGLRTPDWIDGRAAKALRPVLLRLCANYLLRAKRGRKPLDPVARFHLGNGARLERLNWLGDRSKNGLAQSAGLMVNYRYDPRTIERNHEAYANQDRVIAARAVRDLLR
nr:malonyl-CoA decarboxylase [Alphaproteobacteria bacterium]